MNNNYTTAQLAAKVGRSYGRVRVIIKELGLTPVETIGMNKLWSAEQVEKVRQALPQGGGAE